MRKIINYLTNEQNDLESTVTKMHPKIKNVIDKISRQKGCYFSRITGSGSACFGLFSSMKNAFLAKNIIKRKFPRYWCVASKSV